LLHTQEHGGLPRVAKGRLDGEHDEVPPAELTLDLVMADLAALKEMGDQQ